MTYKLIDGDYVRKNGKPETTELSDELLQNAAIVLTAVRGRFYPDKNFGSRFDKTALSPRAAYALACAREALGNMNGVYAVDAAVYDDRIELTLIINHEERQVSIKRETNL